MTNRPWERIVIISLSTVLGAGLVGFLLSKLYAFPWHQGFLVAFVPAAVALTLSRRAGETLRDDITAALTTITLGGCAWFLLTLAK